ncbi:hypothetical protein FRC09_010963 [Ceratobasidium sp. 395]|nr:hypothetical protein FRC09_010963 [Ceratobasidium sp. 395]
MIALPRSATKALKLWSWKDTHGVHDTREDGLGQLDKGTPKPSLDVHRDTREEPKVAESEPIEHEVVAPIGRSPSKLVKKRDLPGNESKKDAASVPPVPVPDPATTAPDHLPSRPATPSTTHAPPSVDSETAEHVIVPSNPARSTASKHNVLVKKNSLSKRAAPKSSSSEAPPDLPHQEDAANGAEVHNEQDAAGREDTVVEDGSTLPDSAPTECAESTQSQLEPETPAEVHPFPAHKRRNSLIPTGLLSSRKPATPKVTRTDKRAVESALSLRTLIIGPAALDPKNDKGRRPNDSKASAAAALRKVNQQLLVPVEANRVIAALRELPPPDLPPATAERVETVRMKKGRVFGRGGTKGEEKHKHKEAVKKSEGTVAMPIHGCCLDLTDEEAEQKHFSKLTGSKFAAQEPGSALTGANANTGSADLSSLIPVLKDMRLVNLQASPDMCSVNAASLSADLTAPDLGFGQSADKNGPLAGSVPSAGSLVEGMEKVGQTLMSLGFASTTAVLPSHVGVYPPKDRMSVLTYWWGYEVVFPPPTMRYLGAVNSISGALLNFLTAFSLFSNGVREMLPFIRYIAQFIDFEWNAIKAQDKGRGVVCAATWYVPCWAIKI